MCIWPFRETKFQLKNTISRIFLLLGINCHRMQAKAIFPLLFLVIPSGLISAIPLQPVLRDSIDPCTTIWFDREAENWESCLPVGNGRLGAMLSGAVLEEFIQFNDDTYWSGGPYSTVVPGGYQVLPEIQRLVFENRHLEAHNLFGRNLMGAPVEQMKYQNMGNLVFNFNYPGEAGPKPAPKDYSRSLDLATGIAQVAFTLGNIRYFREVFVSPVDQVMAIRIWADQPGAITFTCQLRGVRNEAHSNYGTDYFQMDLWGADGLALKGKSADYLGVEGKMRYSAKAKFIPKGGKITSSVQTLKVDQADEVIIYLATATNFNNYRDVSADPEARVNRAFHQVSGRTFQEMREDQVRAHQNLFNRVNFRLPATENSWLPTNIRMEKVQESPDPALAALCYQFGRYLMITASRPGTQPANLQGIWNKYQNPAWDSKYTTNINTEMNYWAVESGNLSECAQPLFQMIRELTDQGSQVAREHYGAKGWVFHQNTDIWRVAAPMDGPSWGTFTTGGAWLCTHIWEHYAYTLDTAFLREYYPVLKGAAQFFLDFLVPHPQKGWLVTNPSTSPENFPASAGNGRYYDEVTGIYLPGTTICYASTIDVQILNDLFGQVARMGDILGIDPGFRDSLLSAKKRLPPMQVGRDGALQEWAEDYGQLEKEHRHYSHLYGIYPGHVISPVKTPELVEPVKKVLEQRGDGGTGWSRAWKMAIWARLHDGDRAYRIWQGYLKEQCYPSLFAKCFTPLQVDGSFGVTAGITEMLAQSHESYIELLPALPTAWPEGSVSGLVCRGGFQLDFSWVGSRLQSLTVLSKAGQKFRLRLPGRKVAVKSGNRVIERKNADQEFVAFSSVAGNRYEIIFQ